MDLDVLLPRSREFTHKTPANTKSHFWGWLSQQQPPLEPAVKQYQKRDSLVPDQQAAEGPSLSSRRKTRRQWLFPIAEMACLKM